ncbi:MAG: hypothetical protein GY757_37660, partial [bacterium]|nr:hypothetical protein [bacterium]
LEGLLPTIKSRCQILKFSPLPRKKIREYLEREGDTPEIARLKSYLSQSNMESVLSADFNKFMEKRSQVLQTLSSLLQNRGVETILLDLFKRSRSREKFLTYFRELVNFLELMLRDIMVLQIDPANNNIINVDFRDSLLKLSQYIKTEGVLFLIRKMEFVLRDIHRNLNTKVLIREFIKCYTDASKEAYDV